MGTAFAHARLGIPHALVHYCARFGLAHGHMVGLLLTSAMRVQARQAGVQERLRGLESQMPEMAGGVLEWLSRSVPQLLAIAGLTARCRMPVSDCKIWNGSSGPRWHMSPCSASPSTAPTDTSCWTY